MSRSWSISFLVIRSGTGGGATGLRRRLSSSGARVARLPTARKARRSTGSGLLFGAVGSPPSSMRPRCAVRVPSPRRRPDESASARHLSASPKAIPHARANRPPVWRTSSSRAAKSSGHRYSPRSIFRTTSTLTCTRAASAPAVLKPRALRRRRISWPYHASGEAVGSRTFSGCGIRAPASR